MSLMKSRLFFGAIGLVMAGGLALVPAVSAYAATTNIWSGEQITVTFKLPPLTNLNSIPTTGTISEIANIGGGNTNLLAVINNVHLISATTNTFVATFTVPAPKYGIMWSDVYFSLAVLVNNTSAFGGNSPADYTYVSPPPPSGQVPEVPFAAALPFISLLAYGGVRTKQWHIPFREI